MSSQNDNKELQQLLGYLRADNPGTEPQQSRAAAENRQQHLVQPPPHIKEALRQKIAARASAAKPPATNRGKLLSLPAGKHWYLAAAALLVAGIFVGGFLLRREQTPSILAFRQQPQLTIIALRSGQTLTDAGLTMVAAGKGAEILLRQGKKNHVYIQSGMVRIDIQKQLLAAEPWFHTPHATITREGTSFTVDITPAFTRIQLHEGRIGVYTYAGKEIRRQVIDAPATLELIQRSFAESEKPDFDKSESEIERLKNLPAHTTAAAEKPRKVHLTLKNGDSVSGIITKSDANFIYLENPRGSLKIPKNDIQEKN